MSSADGNLGADGIPAPSSAPDLAPDVLSDEPGFAVDPGSASSRKQAAAEERNSSPAAADPSHMVEEKEIELAPIGSSAPPLVVADVPKASAAPSAAAALSDAATVHSTLPNLTVAYKAANVSFSVNSNEASITTIVTPFINLGRLITGKAEKSQFYRLKNATGCIHPGTMTLILAPPGHGKSSLLRMLASWLPPDAPGQKGAPADSGVRFNGLTAAEADHLGVSVRRLCSFVDQVDAHLPLMTVRETLDFAHECSSAVKDPARVPAVIKMLGLEECENTILGNALIRGVSGGQKRRVTVGEMLVGDARALFLDEYTNGLDTATAEDITRGLAAWARSTNGSVVVTAQQPTPGLFAEFDDIIVMGDSQIIYHGPRDDLLPFFASMGYACPSDVDVCDFVIDCVSQPRVALQRLQENTRRAARAAHGAAVNAAALSATAAAAAAAAATGKTEADAIATGADTPLAGPAEPAALPTSLSSVAASVANPLASSMGQLAVSEGGPCSSIAAMVAHFERSPFFEKILRDIEPFFPSDASKGAASKRVASKEDKVAALLPTPEARATYKTGFVMPVSTLFGMVLGRQAKNFIRNKTMIIPRLVQNIVMGLIIGSLYYRVSEHSFIIRIASLLLCVAQVAFCNMVELPISVQTSRIIYRQGASGFYPTWLYAASATIMSFPMFFMESILIGTLVYFLSDAYAGAAEYFTFLAILISQSLLMATWFRFVSAISHDESSAQAIAGPSTGLFMLLGGFFVTMSAMPVWLRWLMWITPISWSVRALGNNEFLSPRYPPAVGRTYLRALDLPIGKEWIGYAVLYCFGVACIFMLLHALLLNRPFYEGSRGTRRVEEAEVLETEEEQAANEELILAAEAEEAIEESRVESIANGAAAPRELSSLHRTGSSFNVNTLRTLREALPFSPVWLSFRNIRYTVQVKDAEGKTSDRMLLRGVNGYTEPGKLTALMGASGAGKTTLLDVLAGRKNTGKIEGEIKLNGRVPTVAEISHHTGYVEQFDSLFPFDTVRETLLFAAELRLPNSVSADVKATIVDEVIDILELTPIAHLMIGSPSIPSLSPSQLKRVNIGCELVANPAVLFLDEPTTGLDSRSAQTVMRVVRRIARSGRSVICTIHQPSAELFYLFDRLVLLASGGHQVFFGGLGQRSKRFVSYLQGIEGVAPCPPRYNPSSWMLEEMGVGQTTGKPEGIVGASRYDGSKVIIERFKAAWEASRQRACALDIIDQLDKTHERTGPAESPALEVSPVPASESDMMAEAHMPPAPAPNVVVGEHGSEAMVPATSFTRGSRSESFSVINSVLAPLPQATSEIAVKDTPPMAKAFWLVQVRSMRGYWRNPPVLLTRAIIVTCVSILFGLIYFRLKVEDQANALALCSVVAMSSLFSGINHGGTSLPNFTMNRVVLYRELSSSMYKAWMWGLTNFTTECVYVIVTAFLTVVPSYFLADLNSSADVFFKQFLAVYILCLCYISMSCLLSSVSPTLPFAGMLQGVYFGLFNIFSGIAIAYPKIPRGWVWFFRMLPSSHFTEAVVLNQVGTCSPLPKCGPTISVLEPDGITTTTMYLAEYLRDYMDGSFDGYGDAIGWMILFIVVVQIISCLAITFLNFSSR